MKPITLYSGSSGLNTVLDPQRLSQGSKNAPWIIELAQAVNCSIDERGLVTLRNGSANVQAGEFHSLFCDGGDCFVVQERPTDAAIMRVGVDLSLAGVRSGLTKNKRMAWGQVGTDTFYSNGVQNGYIRDGMSVAWPVGTYQGPEVDMQFAAAPYASHIAFLAGGQLALAIGPAIYINHEPFQYGLFSLRKGYVGFSSPVSMLCPVQGGFFASDGDATWFFRKVDSGWYAYKQDLVDNAPAVEGSLAQSRVRLQDINIDAPGFGRIWCSAEGICLGTDDGTLINLTKEAVAYPTAYSYGACLVRGTTVINTIY